MIFVMSPNGLAWGQRVASNSEHAGSISLYATVSIPDRSAARPKPPMPSMSATILMAPPDLCYPGGQR